VAPPLVGSLPGPAELAQDTRVMIRKAGATLWMLSLIITLVWFLGTWLISSLVDAKEPTAGTVMLTLTAGFLFLVANAVTVAAGYWCVDQAAVDELTPTWAEAIDAVRPRAVAATVIIDLVLLLRSVGFAFFLIPGLVAAVETCACVPLVVTRSAGVWESFAMTQGLIQNVRWRVLRSLLVVQGPLVLAVVGLRSAFDTAFLARFVPVGRPYAEFVVSVFAGLGFLAASVWSTAGTQVLFRQLLAARGLLDFEDEPEELAPETPAGEDAETAGDWNREIELPR
jgi:hypothetical protein